MIGEALALVEEALEGAVESDVGLLSGASKRFIGSGGKRLRPKVCLLSCKAAGGEDILQAVPVAAAVKLLHTASLIHDDINDHSDMRRGQASVNAQWGHDLALLIGDFVFARLLRLMAAFDARVIQVLADCCTAIVEGETVQMLRQGDAEMTEKDCLAIIARKTASLFSACAELGGILAGAADAQVNGLREYGLNLGLAFQIRDDTLDLVSKRDELGKPVASDLEQGKMSLATLFALRKSQRAREVLLSKDAAQAIQLLHDTGALEYAMLKAREYSDRAKRALSALPESQAKAGLCKLADFAVARDQ
ncbi:MAG: polyprenyl synthetase family protein [Anaerolineales bacterium]|nr:MAG: polyprenyl synthetase family protein [Anaerolineales bacterium]